MGGFGCPAIRYSTGLCSLSIQAMIKWIYFLLKQNLKDLLLLMIRKLRSFSDKGEFDNIGQFLIYNTETGSSKPFLLEDTAFSIEF
jgi:hypothetical protein